MFVEYIKALMERQHKVAYVIKTEPPCVKEKH